MRRDDFAPAALVCLDLQRGRQSAAADSGPVVAVCRRVLAEARRRGWPVLHVHSRDGGPEERRSIAGLEPRPDEPVFARIGPSAFSNRNFADTAGTIGGPLVLAGFELRDTVLATAYAAADRALQVDVLRDAVSCGGHRDLANLLLAPVQALAPAARALSFDDLLNEGAPQLAAANAR